MEREVLWGIAPHIIWPLRFVLPHHKQAAPGLAAAARPVPLRPSRRPQAPAADAHACDLRTDPAGAPLKPEFTRGFEYSDCWVEDSRLVVLNARDAAERGATIAPRTALRLRPTARTGSGARRCSDERPASARTIRARALVNAAGPWVGEVAGSVIRANAPATVRLVQGSHIVVPPALRARSLLHLPERRRPHLLRHPLRARLHPDRHHRSGLHRATRPRCTASRTEIAYLCRSASDYLRTPVTPDMVVWTYSGVRPLYDDGASAAQAGDARLRAEARRAGRGSRRCCRSSAARSRPIAGWPRRRWRMLAPHLPAASGQPAGWTGRAPPAGRRFPDRRLRRAGRADAAARYPFLPQPTAAPAGARLRHADRPCCWATRRATADLGQRFRRRT